MLGLLLSVGIGVARQQPIVTPYASANPVAIERIALSASVPQYGLEELKVAATGSYENPFDPADVRLDARVIPPTGDSYHLPGFFYQSFTRSLQDGQEKLTARAAPDWRVRICPTVSGKYQVIVKFQDEKGTASRSISFVATPSQDHGFIGVSPKDHKYFAFSDGASYFPIGANVCWAGPRGTYDYDDWLPKFGANGANYGRLWLAPYWVTLALEKPGDASAGAGMGQFDLADAWKLDYVLRLAKQNGLYMILCIDSYNELRDRDGYPAWEKTPQNQLNGGPLRIWSDFWTDPKMDQLYKNKLRYLVARYGAFTHVLSWEFWNEVDGVRDFNKDVVRSWHERMGKAMIALDPYHHMLTTSFGDSMGQRSTDLLPQMSYVQTHLYNSPDLAWSISYQQARKSEWGKPHYVGEVGADSSGPRGKQDPEGLQVHDPMWVSLATGAAGGAMSWWWDSLIAPHNLYGLYGALSRFVTGINFPAEQFRPVDATLAYADAHIKPTRGDLVIQNGPVSWSPDPAMHPQSIRIVGDKMTGAQPAGILHGVRNHPDLHNPLTIRLAEHRPCKFEVEIGEVSGYGGAALNIKLDGSTVFSKQFPTGENNSNPNAATEYAGSYAVHIPAGRHTIVVNNPGADWERVSYRLDGVVPRSKPPLSVWSLIGNDMAIAWVRQAERSWEAVAVDERRIPTVPDTVMGLSGLAMGTYRAEIWDTWAGRIESTAMVHVGVGGKARISLPEINTDLAVKLVKVSGNQ